LNLSREQQTTTKMAATSDEEMESLLSAFDQIYEVLVKSDIIIDFQSAATINPKTFDFLFVF